jgi:hypothetical protein
LAKTVCIFFKLSRDYGAYNVGHTVWLSCRHSCLPHDHKERNLNALPRVTEILKPFSNYDLVPKEVLANAAARGTTVHALCAGMARGAWIPEGAIAEEHKGYVKSFKLWETAQVREFLIVERRLQHDTLGFTGQLDLVIRGSDDCTYLADLKTSAKPQKTHPVQMAAYETLLLHNGVKIDGAMLVYLNKNGDFPDIDFYFDLSDENSVFLSALECYNYFHKKKDKNDRKAKYSPTYTSDNDRPTESDKG